MDEIQSVALRSTYDVSIVFLLESRKSMTLDVIYTRISRQRDIGYINDGLFHLSSMLINRIKNPHAKEHMFKTVGYANHPSPHRCDNELTVENNIFNYSFRSISSLKLSINISGQRRHSCCLNTKFFLPDIKNF